MRTRRPTMLTIGAIAALLTVGSAVHAGAAERYTWRDDATGFIEFCDFGPELIRYELDIAHALTIVPHGPDGLQYFNETYHGRIGWTNVDTGKTFSALTGGVSRDFTVTDNGDDTLSIVGQGAGVDQCFDADGRRLLANNGQIRWEVLVDHGGTPTDFTDDEFIADLGVVFGSTGTNDTEGRDFCEDLITFTS